MQIAKLQVTIIGFSLNAGSYYHISIGHKISPLALNTNYIPMSAAPSRGAEHGDKDGRTHTRTRAGGGVDNFSDIPRNFHVTCPTYYHTFRAGKNRNMYSIILLGLVFDSWLSDRMAIFVAWWTEMEVVCFVWFAGLRRTCHLRIKSLVRWRSVLVV